MIVRFGCALVVLASLGGLAGCDDTTPAATVTAPVAPYPPVPEIPVETVSLPPVSATPLIWQPGHWDYNGGAYVWRAGKWVRREGHGTMWQDGYWTMQANMWVWLPAHWISGVKEG